MEESEAPDDLCLLPELTEDSLLKNLTQRFSEGHIYTYAGDILISINPFKRLPIYDDVHSELYQDRALGDVQVKPHIFAVACEAFYKLRQDRANQCIVISGESGSGKTEATKQLLHQVMRTSQTAVADDLRKILGTAPVLEVRIGVRCFVHVRRAGTEERHNILIWREWPWRGEEIMPKKARCCWNWEGVYFQ